jgi:hypothetical protein
MKSLIALFALTLTMNAFSRDCVENDKGEIDYKTICEIKGITSIVKTCQSKKVPGSETGTIGFEQTTSKIGRDLDKVEKNQCDISIHECKELAEETLRTYSSEDKCGQVKTLKLVKLKYKVLNELNLKFKTIHREILR